MRRYLNNMPAGGFRYLLENGVVYEDARHAHANTETIVGHTTLATGAHPSVHGMVGNGWFDRSTGKFAYNVEDARFPLLSPDAGTGKAEIDPDLKAAGSDGRSPVAILSSTFSDELAVHTVGLAKIFAVSVKDRGAIPLAGHAGKAFWYSKSSGGFVSSRYYYEKYPDWVQAFNDAKPSQHFADYKWELLLDKKAYKYAKHDDQPWETDFKGFGKTFPHPYGSGDGELFTTLLTLSPAGDQLTLDFTKQLLEHEDIGSDNVTDFLAVSFSSTDYVGHLFGISSLESEDNLLRLDRVLADLFSSIDKRVGLKNVLIVLSADHGGPDAPGLWNKFGMEAEYVDPAAWNKQPGLQRLKKSFGVSKDLIKEFRFPYVYLDRDIIRKRGLDQAKVEQDVADEISKLKGVSLALSSSDLVEGRTADTDIARLILNAHNAKRSGDIYLVFEPHWFINDFDGLIVASTHGAPWTYDTYVPVIFAGAEIKPQRVMRPIETVDVAKTLAKFIGTNVPSGAAGRLLHEVLQ